MPPDKAKATYDKWLSRWRMYVAIIVVFCSLVVVDFFIYAAYLTGLITIENAAVVMLLQIVMLVGGVLILVFGFVVLGYILLRLKPKK